MPLSKALKVTPCYSDCSFDNCIKHLLHDLDHSDEYFTYSALSLSCIIGGQHRWDRSTAAVCHSMIMPLKWKRNSVEKAWNYSGVTFLNEEHCNGEYNQGQDLFD